MLTKSCDMGKKRKGLDKQFGRLVGRVTGEVISRQHDPFITAYQYSKHKDYDKACIEAEKVRKKTVKNATQVGEDFSAAIIQVAIKVFGG